MRVAVVGGELPYPPTSGNRVRTLNLLLRLAGRHRITYLHRGREGKEEGESASFLNDRGIETVAIGRPVAPKSGPLFYARLAVNLASPLPYSVASHAGPSFRRGIAEYAGRHEVGLWQAEGAPYFEAIRDLSGARRILMAHNVESLIWRRYQETERDALKRWYIGRQRRKFERFERRAFAEATRVVVVSDEDAALARDQFGASRVDVVDNGIDRAYFEAARADRDPGRVVFLGSFEWRPNLDAVGLLLDRIFPMVRAEEPSARLDLVGRRPPDWLARRAGSTPGVELHADVADVRPYLARGGVMAVPLRIGGGSRLKILEAMACGLPVVSTRVGAEGLDLVPGEDLTIADSPEGMAGALLACIRDPGPSRRMADRARLRVLDRYDWDALAVGLERVWESCLEN